MAKMHIIDYTINIASDFRKFNGEYFFFFQV